MNRRVRPRKPLHPDVTRAIDEARASAWILRASTRQLWAFGVGGVVALVAMMMGMAAIVYARFGDLEFVWVAVVSSVMSSVFWVAAVVFREPFVRKQAEWSFIPPDVKGGPNRLP